MMLGKSLRSGNKVLYISVSLLCATIVYLVGSNILHPIGMVGISYVNQQGLDTIVDRVVESVMKRLKSPCTPSAVEQREIVKAPLEKGNPANDEWDEGAALRYNRSDHKTTLISTHKCPANLRLLILINCDVSRSEARDLIRNTWGNDRKRHRWKTYFMVGRNKNRTQMDALYEEHDAKGDIILGNFYENYYNLTFKIMMGFEWSSLHCQYDYLFKGDDDVFVNVRTLFDFLSREEIPTQGLYVGHIQWAAYVVRSGKWAVAKEKYKKNFYPRYCSGGGLVLTRDVVLNMIPHFNLIDPLIIDDAYIGELALASGTDVRNENSFRMFQQDCVFDEAVTVHHKASPECMQHLYDKSINKI